MFDKNEKHPINIFLYEDEANEIGGDTAPKNQLIIFSNQMVHISSIDLVDIEAFIIY